MLWLEMSRDEVHGGGEWGFTKCLWSPSRKSNGSRWAFWETLLQTQEGDLVLHLRGKGDQAAFVGFSSVEIGGFETSERPPRPGPWGYAQSFYRVFLCNFVPFSNSIALNDVFDEKREQLREYFNRNKERSAAEKRRLFYVIQAGRLQCLNGAYLSEVDDELADLLLGVQFQYPVQQQVVQPVIREVNTDEQILRLRTRVGQTRFSEQVRNNYGHQCCFPHCSISDDRFLIGGHIARWADDSKSRGQVSNGICLCLMHDRAFERGLFTLSLDCRVWVDRQRIKGSKWAEDHLLPYHGMKIRVGPILPSESVLRKHWARVRLNPNFSETEDA